MSQLETTRRFGVDHNRQIGSIVLASVAVASFAASLLLAVRYPNVPRMTPPPDFYHGGAMTNLFGRRFAIAALGVAIVGVVGTVVILRWPTRASVRILAFGVPIAAIAAALLMPIAIGPPPCPAILCQMHEPRLYELPARLALAVLGCFGGLYFWILGRRAGVVSTDRR